MPLPTSASASYAVAPAGAGTRYRTWVYQHESTEASPTDSPAILSEQQDIARLTSQVVEDTLDNLKIDVHPWSAYS